MPSSKLSAKVSDMLSVNRRRVKIGATLDPDLVAAVDAYVSEHQGVDRSAVIDEALRLWHERQQEAAMERQLREDASRYDDAERVGWRGVRDAAARRRLGSRT